MGNFCHLYTLDQNVPRGRLETGLQSTFQLACKHHIPPLWLALFSAEDMSIRAEDPPPSTELVPHLVSATTCSLNRLAARREQLVARFGGEVGPLVVEFSEELGASSQGFVHLETMEIGGMRSTPTAWAADLERILLAFDARAPQDGAEMSNGWTLYFHLFPLPAVDTPDRGTAYFAGDEW